MTENSATGHSGGFVVLWKESERGVILDWWASLEDERKDRAQLRRCDDPIQAMLLPGFHRLLKTLSPWPAQGIPALAAVAGLLAQVRENATHAGKTYRHFGRQLARPKEKTGNPAVSEMRFYQLQKSRDLDELYRRMRRAVWLLERRVNVLSLADCVLQWDKERRGEIHRQPSRRFQFRLAQDYFDETAKS